MQKEKYATLCATEPSLGLFRQNWWLDATCGPNGWDMSMVERGGAVHAVLPYRVSTRFGLRVISQPAFTPYLGPWLRPSSGKLTGLYGREKDLLSDLVDGLPKYSIFRQNFAPETEAWLPLYWKGFRQTTFYTYVLDITIEPDRLWSQLRENIRTDIKKAKSRFGVNVVDGTVEEMIALQKMTFGRQGKRLPVSEAFIRSISDVCFERECGKVLIARDGDGNIHAGALIVWYGGTAYYLMGGGDPELRNSGATSLCLWEALVFASRVANRFDFEGSMIEPIERFFRSFGATRVPYHRITRVPSKFLRAAMVMTE